MMFPTLYSSCTLYLPGYWNSTVMFVLNEVYYFLCLFFRYFLASDMLARYHWYRSVRMIFLLVLVWTTTVMQPLPCRPVVVGGPRTTTSAGGAAGGTRNGGLTCGNQPSSGVSGHSGSAIGGVIGGGGHDGTGAGGTAVISQGESLCPTPAEIGALDLKRSMIQGKIDQ
jgi:hypothetical protein